MSETTESKVASSSPRKKFGGRKKGTPNKSTADVKALASKYAEAAMIELARLSTESDTESVRVTACKEILDRAYGRSAQYVEHVGKDGGSILLEEANPMEIARRAAFLLMGGAEYATEH